MQMINCYIKHLKNTKKPLRLAVEITLVLVIKVILLWLLWALCFSQPVAKDARQSAVTRMILNQSN